MTLSITPIYAAILAGALIFLSMRVGLMRRASKISAGDGGDSELGRRIRVQGNFVEYVPMALIGMLLAELQGASALLVHLIGLLLIVGRGLHATALSQVPQNLQFRFFGMILTFLSLTLGALINLWLALV